MSEPSHSGARTPERLNSGAAVVPLSIATTALVSAAAKPARERYARWFPERLLYLMDRLTPAQYVAYQRLASEFVQLDGTMPADDKRQAAATKLSLKAWGELRDKLLQLGLGRIEHGYWIDDDQLRNLEIQRRASERAKVAAVKSWAVRRGAADEA